MPLPAPISRAYHLKWNYHVSALAPVIFGFSFAVFAWMKQSSTAHNSQMLTWLMVFLFLATGIPITAYTLAAQVHFTQHSVEQHTLFSRRALPLDAIRGRRDYEIRTTEGIERQRTLVPSDSSLREMDLSRAYNFDEAFDTWFNSLRDLGKSG